MRPSWRLVRSAIERAGGSRQAPQAAGAPDRPAGPAGESQHPGPAAGAPRIPAVLDVVEEVWHNASRHRVTGLAAEVAFFGVLSLFPGLLAVAGALGSLEVIVGGDLALKGQRTVVDFLSRTLTERASPTVDAVQALFEGKSTGLLTVGAVVLLLSLSRGFAAAIRALDVSYGVAETRSWVRTRLLALGLALGTVIVSAIMIAVIVIGPLLGTGQAFADWLGLGETFPRVLGLLRLPLAFAVQVAWAATLYHLAPSRRSPWRWDLPGALLTGLLWLGISVGFRTYLALAATGNPVFGVLGGGLILLVWIWLLSLALLIGGELNGALARRARLLDPERARGRRGRVRSRN